MATEVLKTDDDPIDPQVIHDPDPEPEPEPAPEPQPKKPTTRDKIISIRVSEEEYNRWTNNVNRRIQGKESQDARHFLSQLQDEAKSSIWGGLKYVK
jgi:hypothetical protein